MKYSVWHCNGEAGEYSKWYLNKSGLTHEEAVNYALSIKYHDGWNARVAIFADGVNPND